MGLTDADLDFMAEQELNDMEFERLHTDMDVMCLLAKGCQHHRAYRAIMKPRAECDECLNLYIARVQLKKAGYDL